MSRLLQNQSSNQNLTSKLCNASDIVPSMQAKNLNDDQKILLNANILKNVKEKEYGGADHYLKHLIEEASHTEINQKKN